MKIDFVSLMITPYHFIYCICCNTNILFLCWNQIILKLSFLLKLDVKTVRLPQQILFAGGFSKYRRLSIATKFKMNQCTICLRAVSCKRFEYEFKKKLNAKCNRHKKNYEHNTKRNVIQNEMHIFVPISRHIHIHVLKWVFFLNRCTFFVSKFRTWTLHMYVCNYAADPRFRHNCFIHFIWKKKNCNEQSLLGY